MTIMSKLVGVAAVTVLLGGLAVTPATAAVIENSHFVDSDTFDVTCPGVNAEGLFVEDVHVLIKTAGEEGLVYFAVNVHGTTTYTNLDTDKSFTSVYTFNDRDLRVTDNGDGTLTITVQTAGVFRYYDPEGKLLFVDAGNFRGQFMVDDGGTPTDPDDDTEIPDSFMVLKEVGSAQTAGRNFCEDLASFTA